MLRTVPANSIKDFLPALRGLQIALAKAEAHGISSKTIGLICQGAVVTAENFQKIKLWTFDLSAFFTYL